MGQGEGGEGEWGNNYLKNFSPIFFLEVYLVHTNPCTLVFSQFNAKKLEEFNFLQNRHPTDTTNGKDLVIFGPAPWISPCTFI